jgi:hypothetical protein
VTVCGRKKGWRNEATKGDAGQRCETMMVLKRRRDQGLIRAMKLSRQRKRRGCLPVMVSTIKLKSEDVWSVQQNGRRKCSGNRDTQFLAESNKTKRTKRRRKKKKKKKKKTEYGEGSRHG